MIKLNTKERTEGKATNQLRREGLVPAIVYSKGEEGTSLAIDKIALDKVYDEAGESSLVDLAMPNNEEKKVLIHDIQRDPVSDSILHVDFYEVDLTKKVTAPLELEFVGEAPVAKSEGGIVVKQLSEIEIECLPTDLIKKFKVDISGLTDFSSSIHIKDLKISDKITILNNTEDVVVNVSEPRVEKEETPVEAEGGEGAEGEAKEGDKPAEGEAKEGDAGAKAEQPADKK